MAFHTISSLCNIFCSNQAKQWFFYLFIFTVPPPNRAYLRTLIHNGDLEHLEKVVLDGHGAKLMHETSALDKVSKFIYALPDFMVRQKHVFSTSIKNTRILIDII